MTPRPHGSVEGEVLEWWRIPVCPHGKNLVNKMDIGWVHAGEAEACDRPGELRWVRVVEAPVSPPRKPESELPTADDVRGILKGTEPHPQSYVGLEARVAVLGAALEEMAEVPPNESFPFRHRARRALRGSVPEDENG